MHKRKPPYIGLIFLEWLIPFSEREHVLGSFEKEYAELEGAKGKVRAWFWFGFQLLVLIPSFLKEKIYWRISMFKNYLKIALRNVVRYKGYSFINIFGLAIGMAACIMIYLYVHKELSYDTFHTKSDRIARVLLIDANLGVSNNYAGIQFAGMGPALKDEIPEVVEAVRLNRRGRVPLDIGDKRIYTRNMTFADPEVFKVFDFQLDSGDRETAINEPNTAVITHEMSEKLYGDENPLGETFEYDDALYTVNGILSDIPETSHLKIDVMLSMNVADTSSGLGANLRSWNWISFPTYVLLSDPDAIYGLDEKILQVMKDHGVGDNFGAKYQMLKDVHLRSNDILFDNQNQNKGDIGYVYSLSAVAVLIMLIASFNFMNLATARSAGRAREVGMRKVVGARRRQLIGQFLSEALFLCISGFILALGIVIIAGKLIQSFYGLNLNLLNLVEIPVLLSMIGITIIIGFLSGAYPAFVLSSFREILVLKGIFKNTGHGVILRKVLVAIQFALSIAMIIGSGIVFQQMQFIKNKSLGYDREQVLNINLSEDLAPRFDPFVERLSQSPSILSWSAASDVPGRSLSRTSIQPEGFDQSNSWVVSIMSVDENYFETLGMNISKGRNFSNEFGTDTTEAVILNEAAVRNIGWEEPIGKTFNSGHLRVVGVVKDFHFTSLRYQIEPVVIHFSPGSNYVLSLKLKAGSIPDAVSHLINVWDEIFPGNPLEYNFLDEGFNQLYQNEANFGSMTRGFTFLAIIVACMGLFGLASHTVQQRTKEIGVRKVLGASVKGLAVQVTREFLALVLIANLIAWPAAYFFMSNWLNNFAYHIDPGSGIFLISGIMTFVIAVVTVSYQSIKAARANPVDSLRYE